MMPADRSRAVSFSMPKRPSGSRHDRALRARAAGLHAELVDLLCGQGHGLAAEIPGQSCSPKRLSALAQFCVERARLIEPGDHRTARRFYLLALDLQQLVLEVHQEELLSSTRRLEACGDGLARLRNMPTSSGMLDSACEEAVTRCDYGRVVLSRVDRGEWLPSSGHFVESDASWFTEWVGQGIQLRGDTPEARLLTERRPAAVYDTEGTQVHRQIIVESGQSSSYVIAPLMAAGTVVGFLHADHFPEGRQVDEADRDVLWAFAQGLNRIHERMVLMERVEGQRNQVESLMRTVVDHMDSSSGSDLLGVGTRMTAGPDTLADLTTREIEVLQLIVEGASNRGIGSRLVITEDTVKSHVKQILRKLGVTNRAQAIACVAGTSVI